MCRARQGRKPRESARRLVVFSGACSNREHDCPVRRRTGRHEASDTVTLVLWPATMRFEVEVHQNEAGEWIATAVEYGVTAKGRTEKEALALVMDALARHFKKRAG
jgi:hypothetical protein